MTMLIWLGVYLLGYVLLYIIAKYTSENESAKAWQFAKPNNYTRRDRLFNLKFALFSWVFILLWLIVCLIEKSPKPKKGWWDEYLDKPAKW